MVVYCKVFLWGFIRSPKFQSSDCLDLMTETNPSTAKAVNSVRRVFDRLLL